MSLNHYVVTILMQSVSQSVWWLYIQSVCW